MRCQCVHLFMSLRQLNCLHKITIVEMNKSYNLKQIFLRIFSTKNPGFGNRKCWAKYFIRGYRILILVKDGVFTQRPSGAYVATYLHENLKLQVAMGGSSHLESGDLDRLLKIFSKLSITDVLLACIEQKTVYPQLAQFMKKTSASSILILF